MNVRLREAGQAHAVDNSDPGDGPTRPPAWRTLARHTRNPAVQSVAQISAGTLVAMATTFVGGLLLARWVSPYDIGIWNTVSVVQFYAPFLTLGVFSGLNMELPYLMGCGRHDDARASAAAAYAWAVLLAMLTIPFTLLSAGWLFARGSSKMALATTAFGVSLVFTWFVSYFSTTYRTHSEFGGLARRNTLMAVVSLALVLLAKWFAFFGMLARAALVAPLSVLALFYRRPVPVRPRWDAARLVSLAKVGVPIFLAGQLTLLQSAMDRMFLLGSTELLGLYTVALQIGAAAWLFPNACATVVYPRMAQRYGERGRAVDIWFLAAKAAMAAAGLGAVVGAAGWVVIPHLVTWFLPNYVRGIRAAQWASFFGLSMALYVFNTVFNITRRQDLFLVGWGLGMACFWVAFRVLTRNPGADLMVAAAQAMLASTFLSSVVGAGTSWWASRAHDARIGTA